MKKTMSEKVVEMAAMLPLRMWMVQTIKMLIERLVRMTEWLQLGLYINQSNT